MSTSAKRSSQRIRRVRDASPSPAQAEHSSPTRGIKRRRKAPPEPESEPADEEGSSQYVGHMNEDERLVDKVVEHLKAPVEVQASKDYANDKEVNVVEAFGKIAAKDWTYYIKQLEVKIGRRANESSEKEKDRQVAHKEKDVVHIDLGPHKTFSRHTATIYFDTDEERWHLQRTGRTPVRVNGKLLQSPSPLPDAPPVLHALTSGEVIEMNNVEMMFVLPSSSPPRKHTALTIHDMYLQRLGITARNHLPAAKFSPGPEQRHALPAPPSATDNASQSRPTSSRGQGFQQPIAPAPPNYKRPGTPPSAKGRANATSQHKSPAFGSSGTMLMNANDVDLSLDENKHIKPLFSYSQMITQAIDSTKEKKLNLNGIYRYMTEKYAYYRNQPAAGWQNSIRHNLSLSKNFNKAPRSTDEPGKGMKWEIDPSSFEDMVRQAWKIGRGGHRGSSAPSSPSQLNSVYQSPGNREGGTTRKRKASQSTIASPPPPSSTLNPSTMTPDRRFNAAVGFQDGSPLPRPRKTADAAAASFSALDSLPRSPPTLSSSYMQDENPSFVTPAPNRVHPRLAPPSTCQRPSQVMPTSSPAPFWKYADIGSTPLKPPVSFDMSPSKSALKLPNSSSPPTPARHGPQGQGAQDTDADASRSRSPAASPTRSTGRAATQDTATIEEEEEEDQPFDLTKGFQHIGQYHAPASRGGLVPRANGFF